MPRYLPSGMPGGHAVCLAEGVQAQTVSKKHLRYCSGEGYLPPVAFSAATFLVYRRERLSATVSERPRGGDILRSEGKDSFQLRKSASLCFACPLPVSAALRLVRCPAFRMAFLHYAKTAWNQSPRCWHGPERLSAFPASACLGRAFPERSGRERSGAAGAKRAAVASAVTVLPDALPR